MMAHDIIVALGGKWHGTYGTARCVAHEDRRPSLKLCDGETGRLLVHCYVGCEPRDILAELRRRHFIDGEPCEADRQRLEDNSQRIREAAERGRRKREEWARRIWREGRRAAGTLVELYLRARGITLSLPPSLRFHPQLEQPEIGALAPAMVAAVQGPSREITGIHRTYLSPDGSDKAFGSDSRLSLGTLSPGAVRLAAARADQWLIVAEGIETALSAMQTTHFPAWAALSTSGLRSLILPPEILLVLIAADNDANGAGKIAAEAAASRWSAEGRRVRIAMPQTPGTDFNDVLTGKAPAALAESSHAL